MIIKKRLDQLLFEKGYFNSESKAQTTILAGKVFINNVKQDKPGKHFNVGLIQNIRIIKKPKYVSQGGYKIEKAINDFSIDVINKICLDIGCSTGGFTDCLLMNKAKKIYAVDVGYGQFDLKLRNSKKVILFERTNIRYFDLSQLKEKISIITIDVSFISVSKFLHNLTGILDRDGCIVILIKPQFEAKREDIIKGVIKSITIHKKTLQKLFDYFNDVPLKVVNFTYSPFKGPKGNIEFLARLKKNGNNLTSRYIQNVIQEAHDKL